MRALDAPSLAELKTALRSEGAVDDVDPELAGRRLVAALNERLGELALELELVAPTYAALTRVSLGASTACALLVFFGDASRPAFERGGWTLLTSLPGLLAAGFVIRVGQLAKSRVASLRAAAARATRSISRSGRLD